MSVKAAAGLPIPLIPSRLVGASITIPDFLKPLSAVETVERARPVTRVICDAESTPRSLKHRTIMLSGDADGLPISQVLSEGFVMDQHKHR
ncbi:hypothetical protein LJR246_000668 [Mesorhizobium sp. LjRoot246]